MVKQYLDEISETLSLWSNSYGLAFTPLLHLTGGEPLVYAAVWDVLARARQLGFRLAVLTNGTLVDAKIARQLADAGVETVQVSMEGPLPVHDSMRGEGSFLRALAGTKNLVDAGVKVTFSVTLSRLNAPYVRELAELAVQRGVRRIGYSRLVPCGRGLQLRDESLGSRELKDIYSQLASFSLTGLDVIPKDPLNCLFEPVPGEDAGTVPLGGCSAGISGITVLADGMLMPCRRMNLPIGNLKDISFRELWVTSPILENLRHQEKYGGRCGRCPYWTNCRGCRAVARALAPAGEDNYLAEDPDCWWEPQDDENAGGCPPMQKR
jgi:radical SAM protein with 4Fe4S-binding SPASM domain